MGGLVVRGLCKYHQPFAQAHIMGVVHIAMPTAGAAATYKRMRASFEGAASVILGLNAKEVTPVLSRALGGLQLLPFAEYNQEKPWLFCPANLNGDPEKTFTRRLPFKSDPYTDIYTSREWYGLIPSQNQRLLAMNTEGSEDKQANSAALWKAFDKLIMEKVKKFHDDITPCVHPCTYAVWANDPSHRSFGTLTWEHRNGQRPASSEPQPGNDPCQEQQGGQSKEEVCEDDGWGTVYGWGGAPCHHPGPRAMTTGKTS